MNAFLNNIGAIADSLIDQSDLARYFLSILNSSDEYKKWAKFSIMDDDEDAIMNDHTQVIKICQFELFQQH